MSYGDPHHALHEARRCLAELRRILDAAIEDAVGCSASDMERMAAAKAATERATALLVELHNLMLGPGDEGVSS